MAFGDCGRMYDTVGYGVQQCGEERRSAEINQLICGVQREPAKPPINPATQRRRIEFTYHGTRRLSF